MDKTIIDFLNGYIMKAAGSGSLSPDLGNEGSFGKPGKTGTPGSVSASGMEQGHKRFVSFHMPGHKGRSDLYEKTGYGDFLRNIVTCDITEIPGADALFCPETTLKAVMDNYAGQYGALHSELLVNGSSAGVMAAILGTVPVGDKLIMARNSHHSAFSALRLGGINPVYISPMTDPRSGLVSEISPASLRAACQANTDARAVIITSPNYYGMLSDISSLAAIAHEYDMILIVDQAHGAHLRFFDNDAEALQSEGSHIPFPKHSAEALGADIVINSTHKTLLSFTGSGIMNICTDRVDIAAVSDALRMLQTTSPSYLLMASLDINERIMRRHGPALIRAWRNDLATFYRRALRIPGITFAGLRPDDIEMLRRRPENTPAHKTDTADAAAAAAADPVHNILPAHPGSESVQAPQASVRSSAACNYPMYYNRSGLDLTKINISMAALGMDGSRLDRELRQRGIISEMVHGDYVMLMTGAGSRSDDYSRLLDALWEISDSYGVVDSRAGQNINSSLSGHYGNAESGSVFELEVASVPFDAEYVPLYNAVGRVLYDPIIIYPPGTPVACPGEILTIEVIRYISNAIARGEKVTGADDEGLVHVGADR